MPNNVIKFEDAYFDRFIEDKQYQYDLPEEEVIFMIFNCFGTAQFNILYAPDREYLEQYIGVQSVYYHNNKRK